MSHSATRPPSATMRFAVSSPKPDAPPVMIAVRPEKRLAKTLMLFLFSFE